MRESSKSALCGIIAALSVSIMLLTYISPFLVYTMPIFAGMFLIVILDEIGGKWAFGTYTAVSLLSFFLIADKEAAVFYVLLFGYYPILRTWLNTKIRNRLLVILIKFIVFNLSLFAAVAICSFVFNIDYSEFSEKGMIYLIFVIILMYALFFLYDFLLVVMTKLYILKVKDRIRKLFK
jgi:hypothetical protein